MTKPTRKALERTVADISKVSMITDYQGNVVPQYFDEDLLRYVPITNTWGGIGGGGVPPDMSEIEDKLKYMEKYGTTAFRVLIDGNPTAVISISEQLGIQFVKKDIIISKDNVDEQHPGYYFNVINLSDTEQYDINLYSAINTASNYSRRSWYQWLSGTMEVNDVVGVLDNHGALFDPRERIDVTLTNETSRCIFNLNMLGVRHTDGKKYVDMTLTRAEMKI